jgi:DNA-directed RNA polymerase specialized sigma24 family protein
MTEDILLRELLSAGRRSARAWKELLRLYSNLFLKIIWQFEKDIDAVMDRYLYICTRLAANDFAVLRRYKKLEGGDAPQFVHWLAVVVRNFCVDAHRAEHGRRRLPKALLRLPEFDRKVFQLYYWDGASTDEIARQLEQSTNGSPTAVDEALQRIERVLLRIPESSGTTPLTIAYDDEVAEMARTDVDEPSADIEAAIDRWLNALPPQERLVVRFKFWEDMTARQIARLLKIDPEHRVYTILQNALKTLRKHAAKDL